MLIKSTNRNFAMILKGRDFQKKATKYVIITIIFGSFNFTFVFVPLEKFNFLESTRITLV